MKNNYEIVHELKEEEKQGRLFSKTKESSKNSTSAHPAQNNTSDQNLDHECFKNFFENAPIYGYMVSPEETILEINKTALTNLGYKKEELIGKHPNVIYAPESHEKMKTLLSKWKETGEIDNEEMVIATKQGEKRIVLLSASSVRGADGAILYSTSVQKDVTEINKIYDELNKNLWLQNVKLEKLNETKKTFLKTTSHELRTPMTSIKGYAQMLMKKTLGEINEEQRKSLEVILRNTNRLDQVIQNILDASSLESGSMKFIPRKVNPRALVEEITKTMEPFANKKEMTIKVNLEKDLPDLMIDGERIKQVLMNLVDNAIKFSPDGSMIHIKARKEKEDVLFEVQDFGQGIPKDKQGMIFNTFYQVDSGDDRKFGGAGLSLALSKGIVQLHGGNIWFESTEGTGSTFLFTLPIQSIGDMENTDLNDEMLLENMSEESAGLAEDSVTMNTTDEDAFGSITEYEKSTATTKENEERYRALFNSSFELIYLHDLKGNFIDANPTALKLLGYKKEELGSLNFSSLLDGGQIWKAMKALNEIKKHGRQKEPTEYRLKAKNGTFVDIETTAEMVYRNGKPYVIQGIARDITERKKVEQSIKESEEKYRRLFDSSPDLIIETDEKGNFLAMNPMMVKSIGVPSDKLIGKNVFDIFPREIAEERAKIARKAFEEMKNQESEDERAGRYFQNIYVPVIHPDGKKTIQLIARDITATKKAEEALIESQEKYRLIAENTNDLIIITNFDKTFRYVSPSIKSLGYTPDELVGQDSFFLLHPEDKISITSMLKQLVIGLYKPGTSSRFEYRLRDKSGVYHIYEATAKLVKDESGKHAILSISRDIIERKLAEEEQKKMTQEWNDTFSSIRDLVFIIDKEANIIRWNQAFEDFCRSKGKNPAGEKCYRLVHDLECHHPNCPFEEVLRTKKPCNFEINDPHIGIPILVGLSPILDKNGEVRAVVHVARDITERKRVEERLRETEERFRIAAETSNDAVYEWDMQHSVQWFGKIDEMLGYGPGEFPRTFDAWTDLVHPEDKKRVAAAVQAHLDGRMPYAIEYRVRTKDGTCRWWTARGAVARTPDGHPIRWIGTVTDITERKKAEKEVIESEEKLRRILDSSPDAITVTDLNGNIIECNQATSMMHGFNKKELIGKNALELFSPKDLERAKESLKKTLESESVKNLEYTLLTKDGQEFPAELSACLIRDASGNPLSFVAITKDITERKKAEKNLKEKIEELERYKKLTVNREFKMMDLKEQIKKLEEKLKEVNVLRPEV